MKQDTVMKFVEAINTQNMPLIIDMMSEDFHFIDTYGNKENKEQMKTGWKGYFDWFPDYFIEVFDYIESDKFSMIKVKQVLHIWESKKSIGNFLLVGK